jgi:chaperone BCS1
MNFSTIIDSVLHNQVVTGLSFTALLGATVYQLRNIPRMITDGTLRFLTVELTVTSTDSSFDCVDRWLAHQPYAKRAKMLTLRSHHDDDTLVVSPRTDVQETNWALSPGPGLHMFWWRRRPVFMERRYLSKEGSDDNRRGKPVETLRFRTIGRSQQVIRRLITDVRDFSLTSDTVSIRVWSDHYWANVRGKRQRPLDTIILRDGQMQRIIDDLVWFHAARQWYMERGIPYRRGYLFLGPPGTGKTSLVMSLAGHFNRPICVLNLSSVEDDSALFSAFNEAPPNAIILIEDIDCAFPTQTREDGDKEARSLTKAGVLNALDGITTPDGRIFIMTTNYPERLDPALIRPGRADVHESFEYLLPSDQQRMAARFYDTPFIPLSYPVSPAALQAAFMVNPTDPKAAHATLIHELA